MQYHSLEVISPLWIVAAHKAASQGNAMQLPAPDGMRGSWAVRSYPLADGVVRWTLTFTDKRTGRQTQVAKWLGDVLPVRTDRPLRPVKTHGKQIVIDSNEHNHDADAKPFVVVVDNQGLPMPVHLDALRRNTAQQIVDWLRSLGVIVDAMRIEQVQRMVTI